jgi:ribosomal protein S13
LTFGPVLVVVTHDGKRHIARAVASIRGINTAYAGEVLRELGRMRP